MSETDTSLPACDPSALTGTSQAGLTRRSFLISAAGFALTAAFGCGRSSDPAYSTVVVTVFDVSASTSMAAIKKRYLADFQTIVNGLDGSAFLSGYPITGNTAATSMARIGQPFPAYSPWQDNKDQYAAKLAQARISAVQQAGALLADVQTAPATDLLNAFHDAANVFNGEAYRSAPTKRLVIFSDMLQQADKDDFLSEDLTAQKTRQIITDQRAAGQLPSLKGVRAWAAGATADPKGRIGSAKIAQIRQFWISFFHDCGAELTTERYETTLQNYP